MPSSRDIIQGTLEFLILATLRGGPMHGWGIAHQLEQRSNSIVLVTTGALYPALHRLERQGFVRAEWRASDNNRRAKYYALTPTGRRHLGTEIEWWERLVAGVAAIVAPA